MEEGAKMLKLSVDRDSLSSEEIGLLDKMRKNCARKIILATTLAGSGHPGGALSSLDMLLVIYSLANVDPKNPRKPDRDRVVVSHGHISAGVYSVLSEFGFFEEAPFLMEFRRVGSAFAGHVEQVVPGVEWNTGNLGQGLSAACGMAKALKLKNLSSKVFCLMGDGEQQKGQVIEARRWANKYNLNNLIVLIDYNKLQIGGDIQKVMPQNIKEEILATNWNLLEINGHDFNEIFLALKRAITGEVKKPEKPTAILAHTVMGKGISFMENDPKWHGMPLPEELAKKALEELGFDPKEVDELKEKRRSWKVCFPHFPHEPEEVEIKIPQVALYSPQEKTDCRSAYGRFLEALGKENNLPEKPPKVLGLTCDLEGSVKMKGFHKVSPHAFFESGIQEHHTTSVSGALSKEGFLVFFSTFGVFAVDEVYNQLRINELNKTSLKIVSTHLGVDVGEDGPTHQCIDYLGLLFNLPEMEIYLPADPNQTIHILSVVVKRKGDIFVGMGRSKIPLILKENGEPYFDEKYVFTPGKADWLRKGKDGVIICYGNTVKNAIKAWEILKDKGKSVSVLNVASIRPFPEEDILEAVKLGKVLVVEDHFIETGLGMKIASFCALKGLSPKIKLLGHKRPLSSGKPAELFKISEIDEEGIVKNFLIL